MPGMIQKVDLIQNHIPLAGDVYGCSFPFVDLTIDERAAPDTHVEKLIAYTNQLPPVDGGAAVEVHAYVLVLSRFLEVVPAHVTRGDRLDERPTRCTEVRRRVDLQRS